MYAFGLGKNNFAFWLGAPYADLVEEVVAELGGRRSAANNALLRFISNAELDAIKERPELVQQLLQKEDDDIAMAIVTVITRGLI